MPGSEYIPIYDARTGQMLLKLPAGTCKVAFSPDSSELASSGGLDDNVAKVWDATTGELLLTLQGHSGAEPGMDWSSDGTRIATSGNDGTARVWDARTGKQLLVLAGHAGLVAQVAFSPDGTKLLTGGGDGTARVWDITPAATAEVWGAAGSNQLRSVAYRPDGSSLLTTGYFPWAGWLWDASSGRRLQSYPNTFFDAAFDRDGSTFATLGNKVAIVDASSGDVVRSLHDRGWTYTSVAYVPDGSLVAAGSDDGTAQVWDAHSGLLVRTLGAKSSSVMQDVAFSPDGKLVAGLSGFASLPVWDLSGHELFHVQASSGKGRSLAFSPDGSMLVTTGGDGAAVWSIPSGKRIRSLKAAGATGAVAFSTNGKLLATGGDDGITRIWNVDTWRQIQTLPGHTDQLTGVAFSPDGTRLATVSADGTLRVYAISVSELVRIARARLTRGFTRAECAQYLHVTTCRASAPTPASGDGHATTPTQAARSARSGSPSTATTSRRPESRSGNGPSTPGSTP